MTKDFFSYMKLDMDVRIEDEGRPDPRRLVFAHGIRKQGVVLQNDEVKVSAGPVRHPLVKQAYAYRFDAKDRSVVFRATRLTRRNLPSWPQVPTCSCMK
jgi:hypothetical protein